MTTSEIERTVRALVSCTIQELQSQGLLLSPAELEEYRKLKEEKADCYITGTAAGMMLNLSSASITQLRKDGKIKAQMIGQRWKYKKSEIEKYANKSKC